MLGEEMEKVAELFKVLSNENRLKILIQITEKEKCVHDLSDQLNLSYSNISHHLRKLKDKDLIQKRKEGKHRYYTLKNEKINKIIDRGVEHVKQP